MKVIVGHVFTLQVLFIFWKADLARAIWPGHFGNLHIDGLDNLTCQRAHWFLQEAAAITRFHRYTGKKPPEVT